VGLDRARSALERGADREALIWLWQELDAARANEDAEALAEIAEIAREIEQRSSEAGASEARALLAQLPAHEAPRPRGRRWARGVVQLGILLLVGVLGLEVFQGGYFHQPSIGSADLGSARSGETRQAEAGVYLVPLGRMDPLPLRSAARILSRRYPIPVQVEPAESLEETAVNRHRGQLQGREVMARIADRYFTRPANALVLGVTELDLYLETKSGDNFAFSTYSNAHPVAVVSTARLDPANYWTLRRLVGRDGGGAKRDERLVKMLTRAIGLRLGLPRRAGWDTALHEPIRSVSDIDRMGAGLPASAADYFARAHR
jgi:predicted Zn-dependent protease